MFEEGQTYQCVEYNFYLRIDKIEKERTSWFRTKTTLYVFVTGRQKAIWLDSDAIGTFVFNSRRAVKKFFRIWEPVPRLEKVVLGL